jgi:hypothetical protein
MNNTSVEIELGNGYGYFCNIQDVENQQPTLKLVVKPKHKSRRKKISLNEDIDDKDRKSYIVCAGFVVIVVIAIYICLL